MIPPHTNRYPKPPSGAATGWGRFFCWGERAAAGGCGGVKTPPYGAKDTWAVMARWRAGHARPLRTAVKIYAREGQGRAAALPLCSGRVVDREWMATQGPSESPSHLTVTAPFDKGASLSPCGGSGALGGAQRAPPVCFANTLVRLFAPQGQTLLAPQFRCAQLWPRARNPATPDSKVEEGAGALRTKSNTAFV